MPKAPFEKIVSKIERKKILQKAVEEHISVIIKNYRGQIFRFKAIMADSQGNAIGEISNSTELKDFEKITALFYVDKERYFLITRLKKRDDFWVILNDTQFFKFNRRAAFRVQIPARVEMSYHISTIRNIEINKKVGILEFSSGGMQIYWPSEMKIVNGTHLKGALQWGKGKVLPLEAHVVHSPDQGIFGLRFVNLTSVARNRLKMLSVEIQQAIYFG